MKKLYLLLLSVGILTACDKEKNGPELDYPVTFVTSKLYNTTPVRMYTKGGEVKNLALVKAFAAKYGNGYHLENEEVNADASEQISMVSRSEAELKTGSTTRFFEAKWTGEELALTAKEEGTLLYGQSDEYYMNLSAAISKYKPIIYDKQAVPSGAGYAYRAKTKAQLFATLKAGQLQVALLNYTLKSGNSGAFSIRTSRISNRFDASGITLLRDTDTLLVQEFAAIGVKQ